MLALARELPAANASTQAGKWEKNRFMGVEITGKVLGLIGAGNIGSIVADRAKGLKMRVIALRSLSVAGTRGRSGHREGRTERPAGAGRFHHPACADDAGDRATSFRPTPSPRPRRACASSTARAADLMDEHALKAAHRQWPCRGRGAGRVRERTGQGEYPVRQREAGGDAASGRLHHRGAGECGAAGGRADLRLPADRRDDECAQHAVDLGGGSRQKVRPWISIWREKLGSFAGQLTGSSLAAWRSSMKARPSHAQHARR